MNKLSFRFYYISLSILLLVSLIVSTRVGAVDISFQDIISFFGHKLGFIPDNNPNSIPQALFFQIRLPRVILCAFVGAALSVSGALMQAMFRNPIVEPGLVGTSSGAALGAAFVFVMGKTISGPFADFIGPFMLPFFAFFGGIDCDTFSLSVIKCIWKNKCQYHVACRHCSKCISKRWHRFFFLHRKRPTGPQYYILEPRYFIRR